MKISELSEQFHLINDSHQVAEIRDFLQINMNECDSLFVKYERDGCNYEIVYGFEGIVPLLDKPLTILFSGRGGRFQTSRSQMGSSGTARLTGPA
jgi:hypothetical protein